MKLFETGQIGILRLKNRIVMSPMGLFSLPTPGGKHTRRSIEFYTERARGGVGLIFPAATLVSVAFEDSLSSLYVLDSPEYARGWRKLARNIHQQGAKLGIQLSAGLGRINASSFFRPDTAPVSASQVPAFWTPQVQCRPLTTGEIKSLVHSFGEAAYLAREAGVDVVEIHGYGGYLLDQFMSSKWNRRSDAYGGDLEGRMLFALELIEGVKTRCGHDFPVIFKFTPVHYTEEGRRIEEGLEIARRLECAGVDALHVDAGCYEVWHRAIPPVYSEPGCQVPLARKVKSAVNIPVIAGGKLGDPQLAERTIDTGGADFIAWVAPFWPIHTGPLTLRKEGRGTLDLASGAAGGAWHGVSC